jgi:hypothetical protein
MIITTSTTTCTSTMMPEISTVTGRAYQETLLVIRRRPSAMMLGTFSWTDLAIVVQEDKDDDDTGCCSRIMAPPSSSLSSSSSSSFNNRRNVKIDSTSTGNNNNEIWGRRPKSQSQIVIHRPSIEPVAFNFSWTDLAIIIQE